MFKIKEFGGGHVRLEWPNKTVGNCKWFLHSNGSILKTVELWPTRADAEAILAKYPDAAPLVIEPLKHEWKHGDIFESPVASNEAMVYLHAKYWSSAGVFYIDHQYGDIINDIQEYLKDAKFLFNINDVVKERQAANDAESSDEIKLVFTTNHDLLGLVSVTEMQEFVDYAKPLRFCNSGMHVCDRLLDRFEKVLAQIKEDE